MGHRHSPEEVGRAGGVCRVDGGVVAADAGREARLTADCVHERVIPKHMPLRIRMALFALRFYKAYLSILFAGNCRFQPTCSQYSYEAIERFGLARGAWLTLKRLARCQPFSRTLGYDPVPENLDESEALAPDVRRSAAGHEVHT
jgi:putative membrane protein insertion efficiency factor